MNIYALCMDGPYKGDLIKLHGHWTSPSEVDLLFNPKAITYFYVQSGHTIVMQYVPPLQYARDVQSLDVPLYTVTYKLCRIRTEHNLIWVYIEKEWERDTLTIQICEAVNALAWTDKVKVCPVRPNEDFGRAAYFLRKQIVKDYMAAPGMDVIFG